MVTVSPIRVSSSTAEAYRKPIIKPLFPLFLLTNFCSPIMLKKVKVLHKKRTFPFKPIHILIILSIYGEAVGRPSCVWALNNVTDSGVPEYQEKVLLLSFFFAMTTQTFVFVLLICFGKEEGRPAGYRCGITIINDRR